MKARTAQHIQFARQRHAVASIPVNSSAAEKHYSAIAVAEMWGIDPSTVRKLFRDMPGVLKLGARGYTTLRIPQSVLDRFHQEKVR